MKRIILCFILISPLILSGQITNSEEPGTLDQFLNNLTGSIESNIQWYVNDKTLGDFPEENQFRENSYLRLDYGFLKNFTLGVQIESYEPTSPFN